MSWLRRFLRWIDSLPGLPRPPDPGPIPEFEPCDCPICKPIPALDFGEGYVLNPSQQLLRDVDVWNDFMRRTPPERMQRSSGRAQ